jgi:hypothetical protein
MSQELTTTEIAIADYFTADEYSPYGLCKVVNKILVAVGLDKELPPQMFYLYAKHGTKSQAPGYIQTVDKKVLKDEAIRWTEQYLVKQFR